MIASEVGNITAVTRALSQFVHFMHQEKFGILCRKKMLRLRAIGIWIFLKFVSVLSCLFCLIIRHGITFSPHRRCVTQINDPWNCQKHINSLWTVASVWRNNSFSIPSKNSLTDIVALTHLHLVFQLSIGISFNTLWHTFFLSRLVPLFDSLVRRVSFHRLSDV